MISNALPQTPISGGIVGILSVVVEGLPVIAVWSVLDGYQKINIQGQDGGKEGRWVTGSGNEITIQDKGQKGLRRRICLEEPKSVVGVNPNV